MTLAIELTPSEEARLCAVAEQQGIAPQELARQLVVAQLSPDAADGNEDPLLALFERWDEEDATMTPEDVAAENQGWRELKEHINAERRRAGSRDTF